MDSWTHRRGIREIAPQNGQSDEDCVRGISHSDRAFVMLAGSALEMVTALRNSLGRVRHEGVKMTEEGWLPLSLRALSELRER